MIRSINKNQSLGKSELYSETLKKKSCNLFVLVLYVTVLHITAYS